MELWLLGGVLVLVAIAVWLTWLAPAADPTGDPDPDEEVLHIPMTDSTGSSLPPQGDRFEDQYTSATADLSAGGVAAALSNLDAAEAPEEPIASEASHSVPTRDPVPSTRGERWPEADTTGERIGYASRVEHFPSTEPPVSLVSKSQSLVRPRTLSIGGGSLAALASAVFGAWLYARWQRERNKPINRLRRRAQSMANRLGERLPDVAARIPDVAGRIGDRVPDMDDLPLGPAPLGGAASALLLAALLGTRALRRDSSRFDLDRLDDLERPEVQLPERLALPTVQMPERFAARPRPAFLGLGFGGLAVVAGGSYLVWRLLRGGAPNPQPTWYAGE